MLYANSYLLCCSCSSFYRVLWDDLHLWPPKFSWTIKEQPVSDKKVSGTLPTLTISLSTPFLSFYPQTPLPVKWQPSKTNTRTRPLETWPVVTQWTSSLESEWHGPSPPCTGRVKENSSRSRRAPLLFPSPSSQSWHCCPLPFFFIAVDPPCPGASWVAREPPSCLLCFCSSRSGSSTSCCPLWRHIAMCLASNNEKGKCTSRCITPWSFFLQLCIWEV